MCRSGFWTLFLLLVVAACGGAADEPAEPTTRAFEEDGVRVVESSVPRDTAAEGWALDPAPLLTIGVAEGEEPYMLSQVYGAALMPGGEILVLDSSNELRIFTSEGEHVRSFGRSGDGPCEFAFVIEPAVAADGSIAIYDQRHRRLSVMSPDGDCLESFALQVPDHAAADLRGVFDDGTLLLGAWSFPPPPDPGVVAWRDLTLLTRAPIPEATAEAVTAVPWDPMVGGRRRHAVPGRAEVAVHGDRFLVTTPDRFEVRVFERDGEESLRMRRSELPPAVTDEIVERYRERALRNIERHAPDPAQARTQLEETVFPDHFPGYRRLLVSAEGEIWARRHAGLPESLPFVYGIDDPQQRFERTEPIRWDVFAPDGTWLAVVEGDVTGGIFAIAGDRLLSAGLDDAGVAVVRVHRLIREPEES